MYELFVLPPAQKDLDNLEGRSFGRIIRRIRALAGDPRPQGCLKLTGEEGYRLRVGDHRILYRIDDSSKRIYIYRVKHRKDVYS